MTKIARIAALPIVSAGIIGGAALGLAGVASAQSPTGPGYVYGPDTFANPAPTQAPGWHNHHGPQSIPHLQNR